MITEKKPEEKPIEKAEDSSPKEAIPDKKYDNAPEFDVVEETKENGSKIFDESGSENNLQGTIWEGKNLKKIKTNLLSKVHKRY